MEAAAPCDAALGQYSVAAALYRLPAEPDEGQRQQQQQVSAQCAQHRTAQHSTRLLLLPLLPLLPSLCPLNTHPHTPSLCLFCFAAGL